MLLFDLIRTTLSQLRRWPSHHAGWVAAWAISVGICARSAIGGETTNDRYLVPLPKGAKARLGMLNLQKSSGDAPVVQDAPAISPDGKLTACGIGKHVVIWDIATGRVVRNITAFPKQVGALAFADNDTVLAMDSPTGDRGRSSKSTVKAWDVHTGKVTRSFEIPKSNNGVFSHDSKLLTTITWNSDQVELWDTQTGKRLFSDAERHPHVFFSPDDRVVVTCRPQRIENRFVQIMTFRDSRTGKITRTLELKDGNAVVGVSPDGKHLLAHTPNREPGATYFSGYRLQLLDAQSGTVVRTLADQSSGAAKGYVFSHDGRLVSGGVFIWNVETGKMVGKAGDHLGFGGFRAFSRDGKTLVNATTAGRVFAFDIATGVTRDLNPTHNSRVQALAFSADGKRLASTSFESEIYLWDVEQGSAINRCQVARLRKARGSEEDYAVRLAFAPDDKHLLAQQWDQSVRLYAPAQGREVVAFRNAGYIWGFTDNGRHVHWTPTKLLPQSPFSPPQPEPDDLDHWLGVTRWVASAAAYPVLGQFRARTFAPTRIPDLGLRADSPQLRIYEEGTPFNLSPDGSVLAESLWRPTGNPNAPWERHVLRFSDATTGKEIARVPIKADDNVLWFAPDSRSFVTQVRIERNEALEYSLVLVETRTGQERLRISTHPYSFYDCRYAFSRDGRWLAIGRHKTIEVFDLVRGASAATIPHHDEYPCFAFSPDGSLLASGGDSRTILLWDMTALMKRKFNEAPWSADDKERLWNDLANADAAKAFAAIMRLKRSPPAAIALIRDRWGRRMQNVDLGKLIKQLQSDDFATRKRATDAIEQIGEGAYAALAEALPRTKSLEDRRRIEALMVQCERPFTTPARLRLLRSIEVLDALGTPDAGALLREIAADSAGDEPLQREITRALERFSTPHAAR